MLHLLRLRLRPRSANKIYICLRRIGYTSKAKSARSGELVSVCLPCSKLLIILLCLFTGHFSCPFCLKSLLRAAATTSGQGGAFPTKDTQTGGSVAFNCTELRIKSIKTKRTHEAKYKTRHFNEMSFSNCFCQLRPPESRI